MTLGPLPHEYSRICEQCDRAYKTDKYQPENYLDEICPQCRSNLLLDDVALHLWCGLTPPGPRKKTYDQELRRQKMQALQAGYDHARAQMGADRQNMLAQMGMPGIELIRE